MKGRPVLKTKVHTVSLARQATIMTFNFGLSPMSRDTDQQGWRMAFLYNLPMLVIIPTGGSVLPA